MILITAGSSPRVGALGDTGNDAHITAAFVTDFYLDIKNTPQPLCPGHRSPLFGWGLVGLIR